MEVDGAGAMRHGLWGKGPRPPEGLEAGAFEQKEVKPGIESQGQAPP